MKCEKRKFAVSHFVWHILCIYVSLRRGPPSHINIIYNKIHMYITSSQFPISLSISISFSDFPIPLDSNTENLPKRFFWKTIQKSKHLCSSSIHFLSHVFVSISFSLSVYLSLFLSIWIYVSLTHNLFITHTHARLFVDPNYCVSIYTYMCVLRAAFKQNVSKEL